MTLYDHGNYHGEQESYWDPNYQSWYQNWDYSTADDSHYNQTDASADYYSSYGDDTSMSSWSPQSHSKSDFSYLVATTFAF